MATSPGARIPVDPMLPVLAPQLARLRHHYDALVTICAHTTENTSVAADRAGALRDRSQRLRGEVARGRALRDQARRTDRSSPGGFSAQLAGIRTREAAAGSPPG